MKQLIALAPFAALLACGPNMAGGKLPDAQFKEMANYEMASEVANNCGRYGLTKDKSSFNSMIASQLNADGYTAQQAQDAITSFSTMDLSSYRSEYYASLNVDPANGMSYCALGDRTRAARQDVGMYLVPVNPAN